MLFRCNHITQIRRQRVAAIPPKKTNSLAKKPHALVLYICLSGQAPQPEAPPVELAGTKVPVVYMYSNEAGLSVQGNGQGQDSTHQQHRE